ncbi:hypothetical protein CMO89_02720 [Candidatus Woesearchaeota archaeon]|nr:hypothetical protein [Candidatus Woesearchaeota archaeon]|tara:strand:- start:17963 stop:18673 length:711 start_codon:yes stop_codon:yes gene_type:complete
MKKIILLILLLLNIGIVSAAIDIEYNCHDKRCLEGTTVDYSFIIYNNIDKKIDIGNLFLKEEGTGRILENHSVAERVFPGEHKTFNFTSSVKAPLEGYTFYFYPCFTTVISNETEITEAGDVCGEAQKTISVIPLSKIQCESNKDCSAREYCNMDLFKCKPLRCEEGDFIAGHKCTSLGGYIGAFFVAVPGGYIGSAFIIIIGLALSFALVMMFVKQRKKRITEREDRESVTERED